MHQWQLHDNRDNQEEDGIPIEGMHNSHHNTP
jgi:hypothetical protein